MFWLSLCLLICVQIPVVWGAITSKALISCFDSVCVCWSVFRYPWYGELLNTHDVESCYIQSPVCMFWFSVCFLIHVRIPMVWGAITSKARFACFNSVCVCWTVFRYPWCGEPLRPKLDFHVLTQCVFWSMFRYLWCGEPLCPRPDFCVLTLCVCWSMFRYPWCGKPLRPRPDLHVLTQCVFADPCSDTHGVGSHYIQGQICMFWLSVCLLIHVQIPVVWGAITSKARGTGRALLQVSPWTVLSMLHLLFLCLGWRHWVTSLAILCRPPWVMYTACLALHIVNLFTAILVVPSLEKRPVKVPNLKSLRLFFSLCVSRWKDFCQMHSVESRFVIRPSDILSAGMCVCTFQHINFTGCCSEGVNPMLEIWVTTTAAAKLAKIRAKSCWLGCCLTIA